MAEFESWYNESFLLPDEVLDIFKDGGPIRAGLVPVDKALALVSNTARIECIFNKCFFIQAGQMNIFINVRHFITCCLIAIHQHSKLTLLESISDTFSMK